MKTASPVIVGALLLGWQGTPSAAADGWSHGSKMAAVRLASAAVTSERCMPNDHGASCGCEACRALATTALFKSMRI